MLTTSATPETKPKPKPTKPAPKPSRTPDKKPMTPFKKPATPDEQPCPEVDPDTNLPTCELASAVMPASFRKHI